MVSTGNMHFWRFGAVQLVLLAGLLAGMLHTPSERAPQAPPASETVVENATPAPAPVPATINRDRADRANQTLDFATHDNRDMFGGDYSTVRDSSQTECQAECRSDRRCRAYTFNKWERTCFLKSSIGMLSIEPQGITGVAAPQEPVQDSRPPSIHRLNAKSFSGDPYRALPAFSFDSCSSACLADQDCLGFNFVKSEQSCSLLSSLDKPGMASRAVAGVKVQRAPMAPRPTRVRFEPVAGPIPPEVAPLVEALLGELARR